MSMKDVLLLAALAAACAAWAGPADATGKVYRWVDEKGVVHFGDAIPPEYSRQRHEVLNARGTREVVHGEELPPPLPVYDSRDRALLASYGSVAEIAAVRDRRIGYLDSQNEVAQNRLESLRARQRELEENASAINELATVNQRIGEYEGEIERRDAEIARIRGEFDNDIERYRELRGEAKP